MANPVVQQYNRGSSWSGAASGQTPNISGALGQVASTAMTADASKYASTLDWNAKRFDSKNRRDAQMFDSLLDWDANNTSSFLQWDMNNRATDAQFANALPKAGLEGMGRIGQESVSETGGLSSTGVANTASTISTSQTNAARLEAQKRRIEEEAKAQRASGIGGIFSGVTGLAGTISSVLGQPGLGTSIEAAGNLYGGRAFS